MILEVRTYTVGAGKIGGWLEHYEKHGLAVQQKHLGGLVGFFTTEIGMLNRIVHMWKYDSLAERESRRAAMAKDPDWQAYLKGGPQPSPIVSQETQILVPTAFSPMK